MFNPKTPTNYLFPIFFFSAFVMSLLPKEDSYCGAKMRSPVSWTYLLPHSYPGRKKSITSTFLASPDCPLIGPALVI